MLWSCPTCHDSSVVVTGLKGTLALPCLHPDPSILSLLQAEGRYNLPDNRGTTDEFAAPAVTELLNYCKNTGYYPDNCLFCSKVSSDAADSEWWLHMLKGSNTLTTQETKRLCVLIAAEYVVERTLNYDNAASDQMRSSSTSASSRHTHKKKRILTRKAHWGSKA